MQHVVLQTFAFMQLLCASGDAQQFRVELLHISLIQHIPQIRSQSFSVDILSPVHVFAGFDPGLIC